MRKLIFIIFLVVCYHHVSAQEDYLIGLKSNPVIKSFLNNNPDFVFGQSHLKGKNDFTDTLNLPFFDDFATSNVYPDGKLWADNTVFVNQDFPINPLSIGAATFDALDSRGNAYLGIDQFAFGPADTLSTQAINLAGLSPADAVVLSFFYQAQGRSFEVLEKKDSLVVQFLNNLGAWVNVWSTEGITQQEFKQAIIRITDPSYFHGGFRFRFLNYARYVGNLKQWHLDYVLLNKNRNHLDSSHQDQAVAESPESVLNNINEMPWPHLKANPGKYLKTVYRNTVNNLDNTGETFSSFVQVRNDDATPIGSSALLGQVLPANERLSLFQTVNLNFTPNQNDSTHFVVSNRFADILGGNDIKSNDSVVKQFNMHNYFAYDDGTAESGYGIRNGAGKVALGFDLEIPDTLRAISVHFTQAEKLATNAFFLAVWSDISSPGAPNTLDKPVYTRAFTAPLYTDTINGFYTLLIDTPFAVSNRIYVGWIQNTSFLLNVGWDRNYRYNGQEAVNPNLFYDVRGYWQKASINGTPLIRVHVGKEINLPLDKPTLLPEEIDISLYPNPAKDKLTVAGDFDNGFLELINSQGQQVRLLAIENKVCQTNQMKPGLYFYRLKDSRQQTIKTGKLIFE